MKTSWKLLCLWLCVSPCAAEAQEPEPIQQTRTVSVRAGMGALPLMTGAGVGIKTSEMFELLLEGYRVGVPFGIDYYGVAIGFRSTLAGGRIAPFWCLEAGPSWRYMRDWPGGHYELKGLFGTAGIGYALTLQVGFIASASLCYTVLAVPSGPGAGDPGLYVDLGWSF